MYRFFNKHAKLNVECQEPVMEEIPETLLNAAGGEVVPFGSMMSESYLGRRVYDLLRTIDCLEDGGANVHLIGRGAGSAPVALAALLHASHPTCELVHYLPSYRLLIDTPLHNWPLSCFIENCLASFDLPDIYTALGDRLMKCDPWGPWI